MCSALGSILGEGDGDGHGEAESEERRWGREGKKERGRETVLKCRISFLCFQGLRFTIFFKGKKT